MSCSRGCCETQGEHYRSLVILGPSKLREAEKRTSRDLDAYQRLVASGVQPKGIAGAAELERGAEAHHEVEHTNIITDRQVRNRVTRAFQEAPPASTTPLSS